MGKIHLLFRVLMLSGLVLTSKYGFAQSAHYISLSDTLFYKDQSDELFFLNDLEKAPSYVFTDSLTSGKWILYNVHKNIHNQIRKNTQILAEGQFKDSLRDGEFKYYKEEGNTVITLNYKKGKLHGAANIECSGSKIWSGAYSHGRKNGIFIKYDKGVVKSASIYNDDSLGSWITNYPDGSLSSIGHGPYYRLEGEYLVYAHDGELSLKAIYDRGSLREFTFYYETGEVRVRSKGEYQSPQFLSGLNYWSENTYRPSDLIKGYYREYDRKGEVILEIKK